MMSCFYWFIGGIFLGNTIGIVLMSILAMSKGSED